MNNTDSLGSRAVSIALSGVLAYFDAHKIDRNGLDLEKLKTALQLAVHEKLPEALSDAKDAMAIGMGQVAEMTFASTMRLAGIDAAKAYLAS